MRSYRSERHRLTTLQRQLLKWLKMEGGGCLAADQLFSSMVKKHSTPGADAVLLGQRFCEAVENLTRMDYVEVRLESGTKKKTPISIYDFGELSEQLREDDAGFHWKKGECPVIALTDTGSIYTDRMP